MLIAGGSGVVPLMSMIRHRAAQHTSLEVIHTLTREQPLGWTGFGRRIDREMLAEIVWPLTANPHIYVCGPTGLVESVSSNLVDLGYPPESIRTERFGPTGGAP